MLINKICIYFIYNLSTCFIEWDQDWTLATSKIKLVWVFLCCVIDSKDIFLWHVFLVMSLSLNYVSFKAVMLLGQGMAPDQAAREALKPIITYYPDFTGAIIVVDIHGHYGNYIPS